MSDTEKLIAEARLAQCSECSEEGTSPAMRCDGDLIRRLADALEATVQERDALAAVVERAKAANSAPHENTKQSNSRMTAVETALAGAPAVSLAEHDAQVLEAFAAELRERYPEDVFTKPTADDYAKLHAALVKQGLVIDRFSADLMRRAAAQMDAEAARIREEAGRG